MRVPRCTQGRRVTRRGLPLSEYELRILRALSSGLTRREAGTSLHLSESTIRWHLEHVYEKLDVETLVEAFAVLGWLRVPNDSGDFAEGVDFAIGERA